MKLAISGKGGVGKTTVSAGLAILFAEEKKKVTVIDADPDSNLAATLGYPEADKLIPLSEMQDLIRERTGVEDDEEASISYFKMNPKVDDIPDKYGVNYRGIRILVMGGTKPAGSGCYCPENGFIHSLLNYVLFSPEEIVIVDMVAGIEHLTRGTASAVDALLIVTEPTARSWETAQRVLELGKGLKIARLFVVVNKVRNEQDLSFIRQKISPDMLIGTIAYDINTSDKVTEAVLSEIKKIKVQLIQRIL